MNKWAERAVLGVAALVIGLLIGWAVRGVATYSNTTETVTTYDDWRTVCPAAATKDQSCRLIEQIMDQRTNQPVVQLAMSSPKGKPELDISVPLGVLLPAGAAIALGTDKPTVFPYRTCTQAGCIAQLALDDKMLASFNSAKDGKVLVAGMDQKAVAIPISLKGYATASRAWHAAEQRRNSWVWRMFS